MKRCCCVMALVCTFVVGPARADQTAPPIAPTSVDACLDAAERAQLARDQRRFIEARQAMIACSAPACPLVVRKDCAKWLEELGARLPGIVVSVRDEDDHDLVDVRVFVDGKLLTPRLDGKALPVDPGEHLFRYEPSRHEPLEERVLVREGETNRLLTVKVRSRIALSRPDPVDERPRPVPALSIALAGLGVVGVGAFAFFAASAKGSIYDLRDTCGPTQSCAQSDVDSARQRLVIANVALGVGVVALAGAVLLYLTRGESR
jgi:hypothetical protein